MSPTISEGFVDFSDFDRELMKEHGLCVSCDLQDTCQIRQGHLTVMRSWNGSGEHLKILVNVCSKHQVQGCKTYGGVRGK